MPRSAAHRLADRLRREITSGRLAPGSPLPSRRELQDRLGGSSITVQQALDALGDEGFTVARPRHGTIVAEHPPHRCRFALVLPEQADAAGHLTSGYLTSLQAAALRVRRGGRRVVLHHAHNQDPLLPEHVRLRQVLQQDALAGLFLPAPWVANQWLDLADIRQPMAVTAPTLSVPGLTKVMLDQRCWFDQALDVLVARGVRSVAALLIADQDFTDLVAHIEAGAQRRGLRCHPWWVMAVDQRWPSWARRCALSICQPGQTEPPEALLIADDHLVPAATQGVIDSNLTARHRLTVIGHGNLPTLTPSALPILRLCWDVDALLNRCIELMEQHRNQGHPAPAEHLPTTLVDTQAGTAVAT